MNERATIDMNEVLATIVDLDNHPVSSEDYRAACRETLDRDGALVLPDFIAAPALLAMQMEAKAGIRDAYFCASDHSVYLTPQDDDFSPDHPKNRQVVSSKGLIGDDQVPENSPLKTLYRSNAFQEFVAFVVREEALHPYADPLSNVNIHYAKEGQELGWHFDNSSFAITLLIQQPTGGGAFEYVKDLRDADAGEMNFDAVGKLLDGEMAVEQLQMSPGTLVLFRGRNSAHRVTPTQGDVTRMLAVLAYNSQPGIELSESARQTFYGRLI